MGVLVAGRVGEFALTDDHGDWDNNNGRNYVFGEMLVGVVGSRDVCSFLSFCLSLLLSPPLSLSL